MKYNELLDLVASKKNIEIVDIIEEICDKTNNVELFEHMEHVATLAGEIAKNYGLNVEHAYLTGFLHDVGRLIDSDEYLEILREKRIEVTEDEKTVVDVLHGKVSTLICDEIFDINEADIHTAILYHTTLRKKPTDFEKIIFLADKMTWSYDDMVFNIEETVFQSLNVACYNTLAWIIDHVEKKNGLILQDTLEAYLYFKASVLL